jgi:hypothetical protein
MHPSNSLRGTCEPDDINSVHFTPRSPHRAGHAGLASVGRFRAGYPFGKGTFAPSRLSRFFGSNIWIRAVDNRVNWSEERVCLSLFFRGT